VVEAGSNDGTLLRAFKERGMRVLGIDPARRIAERATASGVQTLATFFTEDLAKQIAREHGTADIVIANNTFANLDNLTDFAAALRALLGPSGVFVFETSYGADVVRSNLIDTVYHEHLSYFMVGSLAAYFARHGLELIDVERIWTKGGSIRGTVQRAGGPKAKRPSVAAMIGEETAQGFDGLAPFKAWATTVAALRQEMAALVAQRSAGGKRLAGYGASVGSVTLIQQFDLGRALDFIGDDKPLGERLRGPGYEIPILGPEAVYERKPAAIIVLAWRYADPIIAKHQRYLADGGAFVIPLPKLSVRTAA
jgi:SAM-dependent methyltransferase